MTSRGGTLAPITAAVSSKNDRRCGPLRAISLVRTRRFGEYKKRTKRGAFVKKSSSACARACVGYRRHFRPLPGGSRHSSRVFFFHFPVLVTRTIINDVILFLALDRPSPPPSEVARNFTAETRVNLQKDFYRQSPSFWRCFFPRNMWLQCESADVYSRHHLN